MTTQAILWTLAGAAAMAAAAAGLAEWRRSKRRDLDRPGWMPWTLIQVLAGLAAVIAAALALKV
ncbi:hypothetical protein [Allosphingosinicella sp.]|uniref:hypothetical protein n=1 Tax=Allosphingosinicella sp. TaxID=2823234 RepID=UPI002FC106F4